MTTRRGATPTYGQLSRMVNQLVTSRDREWCGMPMPVPGEQLILEDRNPWIERVRGLQEILDQDRPAAEDDTKEFELVNTWYSRSQRCRVAIVREPEGLRAYRLDHDLGTRVTHALKTTMVAQSWSLDAELTAIEKLGVFIKPHLWEAYITTGSFIETSRRSGVTYMFRKCRPTIAIRNQRVLAALCLHPIGYFSSTWGGSLVPTDDVIAHLLLMRGDEPMFWRRSNQHRGESPAAGI